jgi:N-acetyl sugar amidotransferase
MEKDIQFNFPGSVNSKDDAAYRQCSLSVMDNIADPYIGFDENGISNYYYEYLAAEKAVVKKGTEGEFFLNESIKKIKQAAGNKKYDCILGVSGGVDSTYLALLAKNLGLKPLCVHFDNGWNSELAVKNIENIISTLGFDLYTYVINWQEFKDIQQAYFKAHVIDIEAISDIAIVNSLFKLTQDNNIKYLLSGNNVVTEQTLPRAWVCKDEENLVNIHRRFGKIKLKTFPYHSPFKKLVNGSFHKLQIVPLLNYIPYEKTTIKKTIQEELGWVDYGGKHYESVFTKFYQGYILPVKFKVDKRKAHLSTLIFSKQLTKQEALLELEKPPYQSEKELASDREYVIKKLDMTDREFEEYMQMPPVDHAVYGMSKSFDEQFPLIKFLRPIKRIIKKGK